MYHSNNAQRFDCLHSFVFKQIFDWNVNPSNKPLAALHEAYITLDEIEHNPLL